MNTKDFAELVRAFHQQVRSAIQMGENRRNGGQAVSTIRPFERMTQEERSELLSMTEALVLGVEAMERDLARAFNAGVEASAIEARDILPNMIRDEVSDRIRDLKFQPAERMVPVSIIVAEARRYIVGTANADKAFGASCLADALGANVDDALERDFTERTVPMSKVLDVVSQTREAWWNKHYMQSAVERDSGIAALDDFSVKFQR